MKVESLKEVDPERTFIAGANAEHATAKLNKDLLEAMNNQKTPHSWAPLALMSALSIELYLKCFRYLEGLPNIITHNNRKLFDSLPEHLQIEIRTWHAEMMRTDPFQVQLQLMETRNRHLMPDASPLDFDSQLNDRAEVFVRFRYWFEYSDELSCNVLFGHPDTIAVAIREAILRIRPAWRQHLSVLSWQPKGRTH